MRFTLFQTGTVPCPYIDGQRESRVFTKIDPAAAGAAYSHLNRLGFRRSQSIVYRPRCPTCSACVPVRVVAPAFRFGRSFRRIVRTNGDLGALERPPLASAEQYDLFRRYVSARHADGDMAAMSWNDYRAMVEETPVESAIVEFRNGSGKLQSVVLVDWLDDGVSAVYSFFEVSEPHRSLGTYAILWLIERTRERGLPYVYLGYWVGGNAKMDYKARFRPLEALTPEGWQPLA